MFWKTNSRKLSGATTSSVPYSILDMILDLMNSEHLAMIVFTIELSWAELNPAYWAFKLIIHAGCTGLHVKIPRKYSCIVVFSVSIFFPFTFFRFPSDCPSAALLFRLFHFFFALSLSFSRSTKVLRSPVYRVTFFFSRHNGLNDDDAVKMEIVVVKFTPFRIQHKCKIQDRQYKKYRAVWAIIPFVIPLATREETTPTTTTATIVTCDEATIRQPRKKRVIKFLEDAKDN